MSLTCLGVPPCALSRPVLDPPLLEDGIPIRLQEPPNATKVAVVVTLLAHFLDADITAAGHAVQESSQLICTLKVRALRASSLFVLARRMRPQIATHEPRRFAALIGSSFRTLNPSMSQWSASWLAQRSRRARLNMDQSSAGREQGLSRRGRLQHSRTCSISTFASRYERVVCSRG